MNARRAVTLGRATLLALAWLFGVSTASAMEVRDLSSTDAPRWRPDSTFAQFGGESSADEWTLGVQWDWHRQWYLGETWHVRGRWQLEIGRLHALTRWDRDDYASYTKVGIIPTVRLTNARRERWYVDAGVGPTLLLPMYVDRERTFSTVFNFDDYIAFGVMLGDHDQHDLSVGLNHISNAGLDQPNPGLNLYSVRYTHRF